ncbi:energy transducer TonB [Thioalkalivibrio sp. XN279]|uniref:energy transducer TonB n=1 Tax=Thioalkalivibrio sp. XN279 TaxID=2714953 RepID=UPI00140B4408|nr:energy transducer TonB [Thioalkalivibrio sp. XN279]NHA15654.1 energy transducer TonB [Thioalkalivibrio sp. XN279]
MRFLVAIVSGVFMALLLFLLMHALIGGRDGFERPEDTGRVVDFVRVRADEIVQTRERQVPKKPPPPDKPPPPPQLQTQAPQQQVRQVLDIETPDISVGFTGGPVVAAGWQAGDNMGDGDIIPIVRIEPSYPRDAAMKGIEGYVKVMLTILPDGSVGEARVIDANPPRIFNREAVRAVLRWKFKPRIVDGQAVSREAEQTIEFNLNQD